ncbi:MAG TPA: PEGA domain-containing protein, partial [Thermotogota bacterium]|nr:PEGA domain-containing protein [Thermotogota bacterium]
GSLQVLVKNTSAQVFLNGVSFGSTPLSANLSEGVYEVTLVSPGFESWVKTVKIQAGQTETLEVELKAIRF